MSHTMSVHLGGMLPHQQWSWEEGYGKEPCLASHAAACVPCLHSFCAQPDPSPPVLVCPCHVIRLMSNTPAWASVCTMREDIQPLANEGRSVLGKDLLGK